MALPSFPNAVDSDNYPCYWGPGTYTNDNNDNRPVNFTSDPSERRVHFRIKMGMGGTLTAIKVRHQSYDTGDTFDYSPGNYSGGDSPELTYKIWPGVLTGGRFLPNRAGSPLSSGTHTFPLTAGRIDAQAHKSPVITMSSVVLTKGQQIDIEIRNTSGDPVANFIGTNGSCATTQNGTTRKFGNLSDWSLIYETIVSGTSTWEETSSTDPTSNLRIFPDLEFHFSDGSIWGNARGEPGNFTNDGADRDGTDPNYLFSIRGARVIRENFNSIPAGTVVGFGIRCAAVTAGTVVGTLAIVGKTPQNGNVTINTNDWSTSDPNSNGVLSFRYVELATPIVVSGTPAAILSFKATGSAYFNTPMARSGRDSGFGFDKAATGGDSSGQYSLDGVTFINSEYGFHLHDGGFGYGHMDVVLVYAPSGTVTPPPGGGGATDIISFAGSHAVVGSRAYENLEYVSNSPQNSTLPFPVSLTPFGNTKQSWIHVVDYLPLSITDAYPDYYQTHYEVPGSDPSGNTYGGWSRDAPIGRPHIGTGYQVADWGTWITQAKNGGADAFTMDLTSIPDTGGNSAWGYSLSATAAVGGGTFKMIPTLDCDSGVWNKTAILAFLATWWSNTNIRKVGGKMVVVAYDCESSGDSTFWADVVSSANTAGHPISFWPMFAGIDNHHTPFMSFSDGAGWWGPSDVDSIPAMKTFFTTYRGAFPTKGLMNPCRPQFYSPRAARGGSNFGMYWENEGPKLYQAMVQVAIDVGATVILPATWNDVAEHTHLMPAEETGYGFYTLMAYYNVLFRTGAPPVINADRLDAFYRTQNTSLVPSTQVSAALAALQGSTAADNEIYCVGYLTGAGTIVINNGADISTDVGAGLQVAKAPLTTGNPTFKLRRTGSTSTGSVVAQTGNLARSSADYQRLVGPIKDRFDSLQNVNPGDVGDILAWRYRSPGNANLTNVRVTLARGTGYSAGTEGTLRASVRPCNLDGTPNMGVSLSNHSIATLGSSAWMDYPLNAVQVKDQLYCIVLDNTDGSPTTNFVGVENIDTTHVTGRPNPWLDPVEWASLFSQDAGATWTDCTTTAQPAENNLYFSPVAQMTFADGNSIGCSSQLSGNVDADRVYTFTSSDKWAEWFVLPAPLSFSGFIFEAAASVAGVLRWTIRNSSDGSAVVDTSGATLTGTITSAGADYTTNSDPGYAVGIYKTYSVSFAGLTPNLQNFYVEFVPVSGSWKNAAYQDGRGNGYTYPAAFVYSDAKRFYSGAWIRIGARPDLGQGTTDDAYFAHWRVGMFSAPSGPIITPPVDTTTPLFGFSDARQGVGTGISAGPVAATNIQPNNFAGATPPVGVWVKWGANDVFVEADGGLRSHTASAESIAYTSIPNVAPMRVRLSDMTVNDGYFNMVIGAASTAGLMNGSNTGTVGVTFYPGDGVITCRFWQNDGSGGLTELGSNAWYVVRTNGADFEFVITPDPVNRVYRVTAFNPDGTSVTWSNSGLGTPPTELVSAAIPVFPSGQILGVLIAPGAFSGVGTLKAKVIYFNWRASGPGSGTTTITPSTPTVSGQTVTISGVVSPPTAATQATVSVISNSVAVATATASINQTTGVYAAQVVSPVAGVIGTRTTVGSTVQNGASLTIRKISGNVQA